MAINYHGEIAFVCPRITSNEFTERITVYWKMSTRCPNQIKWLVNIQTNLLSGLRTLSDKTLYTNDYTLFKCYFKNIIISFTYYIT